MIIGKQEFELIVDQLGRNSFQFRICPVDIILFVEDGNDDRDEWPARRFRLPACSAVVASSITAVPIARTTTPAQTLRKKKYL